VKAYGTDKSSLVQIESSGNIRQEDWTFKRAIKTHRLWLLVVTQALFWGFGYYLVLAHQVKATEDMGYTTTFAASILALLGVSMAIGQLSGIISDWLGREKTAILANILIIGSLVALISVKDTSQSWLLYIFAICFGLGAGVFGPTVAAGAADIFYGRHFGAINGLLMTGTGMGGVIGPWLGGYIYDISGSYAGAFCLCIGGFLLSCILFWIVAPRKTKEL
jgi:MFS family permease